MEPAKLIKPFNSKIYYKCAHQKNHRLKSVINPMRNVDDI